MRRATKDTFGYEVVTPGTDDSEAVEVRRQIKAGALVPDSWRVEDDNAVEREDPGAPRSATPSEATVSHKHGAGSRPGAEEAADEVQAEQRKAAEKRSKSRSKKAVTPATKAPTSADENR